MNTIITIHFAGLAAIAAGITAASATALVAGLALVAVSDITLIAGENYINP